MKLKVTVNDVPYVVEVEVADEEPQGIGMIGIGGTSTAAPVVTSAQSPSAEVGGGTEGSVRAPLAGTVSRIDVAEGDEVVSGQVLLVLEAMKMETELTAPKAGKVTVIRVEKGQAIQGGQPLLDIN